MASKLGPKIVLVNGGVGSIAAAGSIFGIPKMLLAKRLLVRAYGGSNGNLVTATVQGGGNNAVGAITGGPIPLVQPVAGAAVNGNINSPTIWMVYFGLTTTAWMGFPWPSIILTLTAATADINNAIVECWPEYDEFVQMGSMNYPQLSSFPDNTT